MKLELIYMPKQYGITGMTFRRFIIAINGVIVDDLKEGGLENERRHYFDQKVSERIKTFELALRVKHKKFRGAE